jgi:hypothetical protein
MIISLATSLGLLAQAPAVSARTPDPIRVWLTDTTAGARARVHVHLAGAAYLTVLHVNPDGRIRVLFPRRPDDRAWVPGGATFEVAVDGEGGGRGGGATGTIVAAQSRWPFRVAGLRADVEGGWDYEKGLLFQPTAGDPLAALLDIADRMTDGRPYAFDVATHRTGGTVAARDPQLVTPVCLTCVRPRRAADNPATLTVTQSSTVMTHANAVDCSNTVLVNSSCGVIDRRVSTTIVYESAPPPASTPVYVPYYIPVFLPIRRPAPPSPPVGATPSSSTGSAVGRAAFGPSRDLVPSRELLREIKRRPR